MILVKDGDRLSPATQSLIETEVKQLLKVTAAIRPPPPSHISHFVLPHLPLYPLFIEDLCLLVQMTKHSATCLVKRSLNVIGNPKRFETPTIAFFQQPFHELMH